MTPTSRPDAAPARGPWRHALEGALAVVAAAAAMAAAAGTALWALGAAGAAPLSRLVPTLMSMALGSRTDLNATASPGGDGGGGMLGMLGGSGGLHIELTGRITLLPLMPAFLGAAVLAVLFFRPLRRRTRPDPAGFAARIGGALAAAIILLTTVALLSRGTVRLPKGAMEQLGGSGSGGGGLGTMAGGLTSVHFTTDAAGTIFLGLLWVCLVLAAGCLASRRTRLPRPMALSRLRLRWHPAASALAGIAAALCCLVLAAALLAGAVGLTGQDRAAKAAGALLLAGPNLLIVLLTSGVGASWNAAFGKDPSQGGGMAAMLGGGAQGGGAPAGKSVDLAGWSGAGLPLWVIGLVVTVCLLVLAGYLAAARTPARTRREEADALLSRNLELALRLGTMTGVATLVLSLLSQASLPISISLMDRQLAGMTAGLDGQAELCALSAAVLAVVAALAGARVQGMRARRRAGRGSDSDAETSRTLDGDHRSGDRVSVDPVP